MRIGILGGTFDPPHQGHLKLVESAIQSLQLDEVIFLPANSNPFKQNNRSTPAKQRLEMTQLLTKNHLKLAVSDMEITRGGLSYTVDTLGELQMVHPGEYWFILGADAIKGFPEWKNPHRILRLCRLAVAARPPINREDTLRGLGEEFTEKVDMIEMPPTEISSTSIREKIMKGHSVDKLTTPEVIDYIKRNKLYKLS
jgi:nicotinate-nucleotide adenylyltransferase